MHRSALNILIKLSLLVACSTSYYAHAGNSTEVYFNQYQYDSYKDPYRNITKRGHDLEAVVVENITYAKKSVYLAVQELRLPNIAKALVIAKKRGLDVKVVLEHDYNNTVAELNGTGAANEEDEDDHAAVRYLDLHALVDINRDGILQPKEMLKRDAIHILRHGKVVVKDDSSGGSSSGLMHHKFLVIDGKKIIVTSANLTMSGVHGDVMHRSSVGNSNAMVVLYNKELSTQFTNEFNLMWGKSGTNLFGLSKPYRTRKVVKSGGASFTVQFSPTATSRPWKDSGNGLIASQLANAKYEALLGLFVFSEQRFSNILYERMSYNPNFNLGILVERKFATRSYSELLDIWGLEILEEDCEYEAYNQPWENAYANVGVPIMNSNDVLHHKFAVIDEKTVVFGSQNWSNSANTINDETVLIIEDRAVANAFREEYIRLESSSRLGAPASLHDRIKKMQKKCGVDRRRVL